MNSPGALGADAPDFLGVTERGGEPVTQAQVDRFLQRYVWAGRYCQGKDVLEMACGTGPGLGYLASVARRLVAGDISPSVLAVARAHYGQRIDLHQFDATRAPFEDGSFDVVILFEAIYYVPDLDALAREVRRLLRPGGVFLVATANKDLFDFNPSPFSRTYLNPPDMVKLFGRHGMRCEFFAGSPVGQAGPRTRLLRTLKRLAARYHLIPGTMAGKRLLKRLVFGRLVTMPAELQAEHATYVAPTPIAADRPDHGHLVLYCAATREP